MGKGRARARGEGNAEYLIVLFFVLICAVVGLFTSFSNTIKKVQLEKGLCIDCTAAERAAARSGTASPATDTSRSTPAKAGGNTNGLPSSSGSSGNTDSTVAANNTWWSSFKSFLSWW